MECRPKGVAFGVPKFRAIGAARILGGGVFADSGGLDGVCRHIQRIFSKSIRWMDVNEAHSVLNVEHLLDRCVFQFIGDTLLFTVLQ